MFIGIKKTKPLGFAFSRIHSQNSHTSSSRERTQKRGKELFYSSILCWIIEIAYFLAFLSFSFLRSGFPFFGVLKTQNFIVLWTFFSPLLRSMIAYTLEVFFLLFLSLLIVYTWNFHRDWYRFRRKSFLGYCGVSKNYGLNQILG